MLLEQDCSTKQSWVKGLNDGSVGNEVNQELSRVSHLCANYLSDAHNAHSSGDLRSNLSARYRMECRLNGWSYIAWSWSFLAVLGRSRFVEAWERMLTNLDQVRGNIFRCRTKFQRIWVIWLTLGNCLSNALLRIWVTLGIETMEKLHTANDAEQNLKKLHSWSDFLCSF